MTELLKALTALVMEGKDYLRYLQNRPVQKELPGTEEKPPSKRTRKKKETVAPEGPPPDTTPPVEMTEEQSRQVCLDSSC